MEVKHVIDEMEAGELAIQFETEGPDAVLQWAVDRFDSHFALASSFQAEEMVILDLAWKINPEVRVFTLDTGRLHQETYDLMDEIRARYPKARLEVYFPDAAEVERMVAKHGLNLMLHAIDLRLLCCHVRKVRPLNRALGDLEAWATGLRREQWASRTNIRKIELDHDHGGIVKLNPLADWTKEEVWEYVKEHDLPLHKLYTQGYVSIGCVPCTRPIKEGEDPRSGRWWWETGAAKECGMHCSIYTGSFEHELHALLKETGKATKA
jgi:phosphoadenosine phosphosulfate reductase